MSANSESSDRTVLPRKLMLLIAVGQGMALLLLKTSADGGTWPSQDPIVAYPLWALALSVPVLLLLSLEVGKELRIAKLVGGFAIVVALVAAYTGSQTEPWGAFPVNNITGVFVVTMALACFKALMYLQQRGSGQPLAYEALFTFSWRNALTFGLAIAFTFAVWLILMLWGSLFDVIGISFFKTLFEMDWFRFLVLGLAHGTGVIIFRNLVSVIDVLTRLERGLITLLLPLVVIVAVLFVASLPFTGLDALWDTGSGTALVLWLLAILLFFTNAVYQDGRGDPPYALIFHRAIYVGLLTMPVLAALAFYGLYLRLAEYGWTVARCWAFVVWLMLTLFAVGYAVGILRRRDEWTRDLARVNTVMGLFMLALLLLANSPLLDFRKISAASQLHRIDAGIDSIGDFDAWYAHTELGRAGYLALESLKARVGDSDPDLLARLETPAPYAAAQALPSVDELWDGVDYRPEPFPVPPEVRESVQASHWTAVPGRQQVVAFRDDLDGDDDMEYVFVLVVDDYVRFARIVYRQDGQWVGMDAFVTDGSGNRAAERLGTGEIRRVPRRFDDLQIGDFVIRPAH